MSLDFWQPKSFLVWKKIVKERFVAIGLLIAAAITALILWLKKKEEPPLPDFCAANSDCPPNYYCKDGKCVKLTPEVYEIRLSGLEISSAAYIGLPVYISCRATLYSDVGVTAARTITLLVNGIVIGSNEVTLTKEIPYEFPHTTVEFEYTPLEVRVYNVELDGLKGSFEVTELIKNYITPTGIELIYNAYPEIEAALAAPVHLSDKERIVYPEMLKTRIELIEANAYYNGIILSGNARVSHSDGIWPQTSTFNNPGFKLRLCVEGATITMPGFLFFILPREVPLKVGFLPAYKELVDFAKGEKPVAISEIHGAGTYPVTIEAELRYYYRKPNGLMSSLNKIMKIWRIGILKL